MKTYDVIVIGGGHAREGAQIRVCAPANPACGAGI